MKDYYIIGAGGHAAVIKDILKSNGIEVKGFFADFSGVGKSQSPIIGKIDCVSKYIENSSFIIAIGDNNIRKMISRKFLDINYITAIHPSAVIGSEIKVGKGTAVFPNTVVNSGSIIGNHVILNSSSTVEHDCIIDDFVHISPGSVLCGGVHVGEGSIIGAGATVIPRVNIGKNVIIGAGAVVINNIPDNIKVVGVPAVQI